MKIELTEKEYDLLLYSLNFYREQLTKENPEENKVILALMHRIESQGENDFP